MKTMLVIAALLSACGGAPANPCADSFAVAPQVCGDECCGDGQICYQDSIHQDELCVALKADGGIQ